MTITVDLVEAFLKCPTKCFLRSGGEAGTGNAYAAWLQTKNNAFRIEGTKRLVAGVAPRGSERRSFESSVIMCVRTRRYVL